MTDEYSREQLIEICVKGFVPEKQWRDRDSAGAQRQLGEAYALLLAGCDFTVVRSGSLATNDRTVWVAIQYRGFDAFEYGYNHTSTETFYLPTFERLAACAGKDWY